MLKYLMAAFIVLGSAQALYQASSTLLSMNVSDDIACVRECESFINVTMLRRATQTDINNLNLAFNFSNGRTTGNSVPNTVSGVVNGIGYELYQYNGETCANVTAYDLFDNPVNVTECNHDITPVTIATIRSNLRRAGDGMNFMLKGTKTGAMQAVKWSIQLENAAIDPMWNGIYGMANWPKGTTTNYNMDNSSKIASIRFTPDTDIPVSNIYFDCSTVGAQPTYNVSIQTDSGGVPSGTALAYGDTISTCSAGQNITLNTQITLSANTTYHIHIAYRTGTISGTAYLRLVYPSAPVNYNDFDDQNMTNWDITFMVNPTGRSWSGNTTGTREFLLWNRTATGTTPRGRILVTPVAYYSSVSNITGEVMYFDDNYTITGAGVAASTTSASSTCGLNLSVVNMTTINSSWGAFVLLSCITNNVTNTMSAASCNFTNNVSVLSGSSYVLLASGKACNGTGIIYTTFGNSSSTKTQFPREKNISTWKNYQSYYISSKDNGSTLSYDLGSDLMGVIYGSITQTGDGSGGGSAICGGTGECLIDCALYTNMSYSQDAGGYGVRFKGTGMVTLYADITSWASYIVENGCSLLQTSGGRMR